jgi:hypothetical protein
MDKRSKQQFLSEVNSQPTPVLLTILQAGHITIEEMLEAGLKPTKAKELEKQMQSFRPELIELIEKKSADHLAEVIRSGTYTLDEMIEAGLPTTKVMEVQKLLKQTTAIRAEHFDVRQLCQQIDTDQIHVTKIKEHLLRGQITDDDLRSYANLHDDIIKKIRDYMPVEPNFYKWSDQMPLQTPRTDVYFFGQPGSGKSCILASIFKHLDDKASMVNETYNLTGEQYKNQLIAGVESGVLPASTIRDGVNYISMKLLNSADHRRKHPLNFIEMSGEMFNDAYQGGISDQNLAAKEYLDNDNRKLIFFVIDYDQHKNYSGVSSGPSQNHKFQTILDLLDQFGVLDQTDGIYILVSKADLFPSGVNPVDFAEDFIKTKYRNLVTNLNQKAQSKGNIFVPEVYPYSIGKIRFKGLLVDVNPVSPEHIVEAIERKSFFEKLGFFSRLRG